MSAGHADVRTGADFCEAFLRCGNLIRIQMGLELA